ncbi:benzoate 4-monooxygenase cytochrome p450 [Ophiostoma piceae UAMH 11346]|uniref:Benzoate 4-monooxygenase cytochrome p450 n=1 Tax=Ophiostoma piceae (strain UAMH 11346) TaxID=1262450 RepID=S3BZZ7_OPHP1|nr:benzoate 4-monooxygenase cytochrome p450 [Ophiostoma piceae UAMH 11346]
MAVLSSLPLGWLACAIAVAVILRALYRARSTPLAQVPSAGLLAPVSRLAWAFPHEYRGTITLDLPKLHDRLGPLVRIGPTEVSYYSLDAYDVIHKAGSKFEKDPRVYGGFVQDGHPALFSITDPTEHAQRRRLMGQLYNRSKVPLLEELMLHHIANWTRCIARSPRAVDLPVSCRALEADIISDFSFGSTIGAIDAWAAGRELGMVAKNDELASWMPVITNLPGLWSRLEYFQTRLAAATAYQPALYRGLAEFVEWSQSAFDIAMKAKAEPSPSISSVPHLFQTLVRSGLPFLTALGEAKENMGPGTDTTSATLAHVLWALAHNGTFQDELFLDLQRIGFSTDMASLEGVPRLKACVKEGVRWAGAAAAMLPRVVPEGGVELLGTFLPAGTVLTSSPIWYLRDRTAFPNPDEFNPYRWLTPDARDLRQDALRDKYYIPFSKGANICIGSHFAYYELYLSVSQAVRQFRITVPGDGTPSPAPRVRPTTGSWQPVLLPQRKEWVAAVVTDDLRVTMTPRTSKKQH